MSNPLVSIIIPVYNVEKYLEKCLDSIVSQSYSNIEVVIVDDGSTDSSLSILQEYAKKDIRLVLVSQENRGLQRTRQVGLQLVKGEYVCFVDSDDSLEPRAIELMVNCALETKVDLVVSRINIETNKTKKIFASDVFYTVTSIEYLKDYLLVGRVGWNICSKLFKMDLIKENSLEIPISVVAGEDALFIILLAYKMKGNVSMVNVPTYNYYFHSDSITHSKNIKYIYDNFKVADYVQKTLKNTINEEYLVAFRLLCMSSSIRYGWFGNIHPLNREAINLYRKYPESIKKIRLRKRIQIFLLIHCGDFISKYFFNNYVEDEG